MSEKKTEETKTPAKVVEADAAVRKAAVPKAAVTPDDHGSHGHAAAGHGHAAAGHHAPNRAQYWRIFFVLLVLTILEVGVAYLQHYVGKTALVSCLVGMAVTKAAIVAFFYMHLNHESKVMRWSVAIPLMFPALYAFILIAEGTYRAVWGLKGLGL